MKMSQSTINLKSLEKNQVLDQQHSLYRSNSCERKKSGDPKWLKQIMEPQIFNDQENKYQSYQNQQRKKYINKIKQKIMQKILWNQKQLASHPQNYKSQNQYNNLIQLELKEQISKEFDLTLDALQLEAFYYWVTEIGSSISPIFSSPPIISYYLYGMLLFDFKQAQNLLHKDKGLEQFWVQLKSQSRLIDKIKMHSTVKSQAYRDKKIRMYFDECAFLSILPQNITINEIDQNMIIEDLLLYSRQYIDIIHKGNAIEQIDKLLIHTAKNITLGYIRFIFFQIQKDEELEFRYPISQFDDDQCLEYNEIQNTFSQNQLGGQYNLLKPFLFHLHPHSENALTLWLILDAISNKKSIFKLLQNSFENNYIEDSQLILKQIQLEITSKNKQCSECVKMFNQFPIQYYCDRLRQKFNFKIQNEIYLIILIQFLQNPYYRGENSELYNKPTLYEQISQEEEQSDIKQQQNNNHEQDNNYDQNQVTQNQQQNLQQTHETQQQFKQDQQLSQTNQIQQNENENNQAQIQNIQQTVQIDFKQQQQQTQIEQNIETQEITQQQFAQKIRYFIIQKELEVTGIISQQMFDKRYKDNGQQHKLKIHEMPLTNTYFVALADQRIWLKNNKQKGIHESLKEEFKKHSETKQNSSNRINGLLRELKNNKDFFKIKDIQRQKILLEKQSREQSQIFTYEKLSDDFQTKFFSSLVIQYCQNVKNKNFNQFQIAKLNKIFGYFVKQKEEENETYNQILTRFSKQGIIFNPHINKVLLLKDYLFLLSWVNPVKYIIKKKQRNIIHNECAFQVLSFDKATQQWQVQWQSNQFHVTIKSCQEFYQVIQQSLSTINQQQNVTQYLLICTLYEIAEGCTKQLGESLSNLLIPLQFVKIEFCSIDLKTQNNNDLQFQQKIEQSQYQIEVTYKNYNLLNIDNFQNRYKADNCMARTSFNHFTKEVIQSFSSFDCEHHNLIMKK